VWSVTRTILVVIQQMRQSWHPHWWWFNIVTGVDRRVTSHCICCKCMVLYKPFSVINLVVPVCYMLHCLLKCPTLLKWISHIIKLCDTVFMLSMYIIWYYHAFVFLCLMKNITILSLIKSSLYVIMTYSTMYCSVIHLALHEIIII
jgi:hypothetical protein